MKPYWQLYKKLECLPEGLPEPSAEAEVLTFPLRTAWRVLIDLLAQELIYEQKVEFLERCLEQDIVNLTASKNFWCNFWKLLD
jgi:hypothetical protein